MGTSMRSSLKKLLAALAAAAGAASIWVSAGTIAVVESDTAARVVAVPAPWTLGLGCLAAAVLVWFRQWPARSMAPLLPAMVLWLPFVPGRVPDAFLAWQGPAEWLVWLLVVTGFALQWRHADGHPPSADRLPQALAAWLAAAATVALVLAGWLVLSPRLPGGDEPHYLVIAQSLWRDHDVAIGNNHERLDYIPFTQNRLEPHYVRRGLDGQIYSVHAPGLSALILPAFMVAGVAGARVVVMLMVAVAAALTWRAARTLTNSSGAAWVGWAAVFVTAPMFMQSFTIMPDAPATLGVAAGVWLLTRLASDRPASLTAIIAVAASLALLPWLHSRFALVAAALGLALVIRLRQRQGWAATAAFALVPAVSAAAWFGFFLAIWGTPSPNAPWGDFARPSLDKVVPGLLGLLFDQQVGLLAHAPVYAAAAVGSLALWWRQRRLGGELLAAALPYALVVSAFDGWPGGFGGPARYLVAVLPMGALTIAWLWSRAGVVARALIGVSLVTSVTMLAGRLLTKDGAAAYLESYGREILFNWWMPAVDAVRALPNMRAVDGAVVAGVWTAIVVVMVWLVVRFTPGRTPALAWVSASVGVALTPVLAMSLAWQTVEGQSPRGGTAVGASQIAFLGSWRPSWRPVLVQWRSPFVVSPSTLLRRLDVPFGRSRRPSGVAFTLPDVPAGEYVVWAVAAQGVSGQLEVRSGDSGLPLEHWTFDAVRERSLAFALPVGVRTLVVTGDARVMDAVEAVSLRVQSMPQTPASERAVEAARLSAWRGFFLDSQAYVERQGFWTVGGATTRVLFERDSIDTGELRLQIDSGPVPTSVEVVSPLLPAPVRLAFGAHERKVIPVPVDPVGRAGLDITTSARFLPAQHDSANGDHRHLGVWVEPR